MSGVLALGSYLCAMLASGMFWFGVSHDSMAIRIAAAAAASVGIWMAESVERRIRSRGAAQAATLNGLLLLVMATISLYLHFTS